MSVNTLKIHYFFRKCIILGASSKVIFSYDLNYMNFLKTFLIEAKFNFISTVLHQRLILVMATTHPVLTLLFFF